MNIAKRWLLTGRVDGFSASIGDYSGSLWNAGRLGSISLLLGGAFLALVDLLARTVVAPAELPLGVVTAFFGAPFFALALRTMRGRG